MSTQTELTRVSDLLEILANDVKACFADYKKDNYSMYRRRNYCRAVFAWIDGLISTQCQMALDYHKDAKKLEISGLISLNHTEILIAEGKSYKLHDSGAVSSGSDKYYPAEKILAFSFYILAKVFDLKLNPKSEFPFTLDRGGPGWNAYKKAKEIRNRITHPKTENDLEIIDDDMIDIMHCFLWLATEWLTILEGTSETLKKLRHGAEKKKEELDKEYENIQKQKNQLKDLKRQLNKIPK